MPKEFLNSLLEISKERLRSPIWRTFGISFVLFNWRAILFLLYSNLPIEEKFIIIESKYSSYWSFGIPLLITSIITLGFPFILWAVESFINLPNSKRKAIKNRTILDQSEHREKMAESEFIIEDKKSGAKTIAEFQDKIKSLESEKEMMREAFNIEKENLNQTNKVEKDSLLSQIKNLRETVKTLTEENNHIHNSALRDASNRFNIQEVYESLKTEERQTAFYETFDGFSNYSSSMFPETIKLYFSKLDLWIYENDNLKNTDLAYELYKYIYYEKNSNAQIRKDENFIFNMEIKEFDILKSYPKNNTPIQNKKDFYKKLDIEGYTSEDLALNYKGIQLRNMAGYIQKTRLS